MTRLPPRALWRMARRDLRRHARRSALIVTLVALPVAGLAAGIVLLQAATVTGEQIAAEVMGAAALRADSTDPEAMLDPAALPPGSRVLPFSATGGVLQVGPGNVQAVSLTDIPLGDPLTAGMLDLREGRALRAPGEVAVSPVVLRELHRQVGDTIQVVEPPLTLRVTGAVLNPADIDAWVAVTGRGALGPDARRSWLISLPRGVEAQSVLRGAGLSLIPRELATDVASRPSNGVLDPIPTIAALALMIAALIVAAAFAAGVRREIHDLGLLAAVGGTPAQLRASVLVRGITLGLVGGLTGVALGLLGAVAVYPFLDRFTGRLPHPLVLPAIPLLGAATAAVLAGTAAALFPARFAARVPPLDALHARVPTGPPPRHVSRLGILAIVLGSALTAAGTRPINNLAVSLAGLAVLLGGFVACSTAVVAAVEPLARRRLPLAGRVAARQAARTRSRTGPAVAAITVALAVPVFVSSVALTGQADDRAHWLPAQGHDQLRISHAARSEGEAPPAAVRAVVAAIPGAVAAPLRQALFPDEQMPVVASRRPSVSQTEEPSGVYVGGDDLLAALGAHRAAADLAAGKVVGVGRATIDNGRVALHREDFRDNTANTARSILDPEATVLPAAQIDDRPLISIHYVISASEAQRQGLTSYPQGTLVRAPHAITPDELQAARAALAPYPELTVDAGPGTPPQSVTTPLLMLLFAVSGAVALAVVAAMVALAQAEARTERRTLFAVGASPAVLRGTAAATAGLLALLGGVLAVPAGLLPLAAVYATTPAAVPLVVPWAGLAVGAVLVPALAAAGSATLTRTTSGSQGPTERLS
jgi:putative ABC transport system permease protein